MYVLQTWTFVPGGEGEGTITVPGVYAIEQFAHITNLTRNIPLFDSAEYEAKISVTDDGVNTTITLAQNTSFCQSSDELQILVYDEAPAAVADVAITNFPATQNVSGSVGVTNFPATQNVSGSVGVTNFPATQNVSGSVGVTNAITNPVPVVEGWNISNYDYLSLGYTDGNVSSVVYKQGGAAGTTVATLTLAYDGSGNLLSVTKS